MSKDEFDRKIREIEERLELIEASVKGVSLQLSGLKSRIDTPIRLQATK